MSYRSGFDRPRLSRKRVLLMGIALLAAVTFGITAVSRVLFASWSIGLGGRDTLTGAWVGALQARQGAEYGLYLDLEYQSRDSSGYRSRAVSASGSINLQGRATLCTPPGERYEYAVQGHADPLGAVKNLWLEYGDPKLSALNLRVSGTWQPPALTLAAEKNPFLPDGRFVPTRVLSSDDPDDSFAPFALTKGDPGEFEAICRRIRR